MADPPHGPRLVPPTWTHRGDRPHPLPTMSPLARSLTRCQEELQRAEGVARAAHEAEMRSIDGCDRWEHDERMGWEEWGEDLAQTLVEVEQQQVEKVRQIAQEWEDFGMSEQEAKKNWVDWAGDLGIQLGEEKRNLSRALDHAERFRQSRKELRSELRREREGRDADNARWETELQAWVKERRALRDERERLARTVRDPSQHPGGVMLADRVLAESRDRLTSS